MAKMTNDSNVSRIWSRMKTYVGNKLADKMNKDGSNAEKLVNFPNDDQIVVVGDMESEDRAKIVLNTLGTFKAPDEEEPTYTVNFVKTNGLTGQTPLPVTFQVQDDLNDNHVLTMQFPNYWNPAIQAGVAYEAEVNLTDDKNGYTELPMVNGLPTLPILSKGMEDVGIIPSSESISLPNGRLSYWFYKGCAVVLDNEIHILGGNNSYRNHYKWNGSKWVSVSTLPCDFYEGRAIVRNNILYILGSYSSNYAFYKFNKTEGTWDANGLAQLPYRFYGGAAVLLNNEIHILGSYYGYDGAGTSHYKWNGATWSRVSTLPYSFSYGSAVVLNGEIHILGGTGANTSHYKYSNGEWVSVSTLPYGVYWSSAEVLDGEIHIFGGSNSLRSHYKYSNGEWVFVCNLPYPSWASSSVVKNNRLYIIGGGNNGGKYFYTFISHNYNCWVTGGYGDLPFGFYDSPAIVSDDKICVLAGYGGDWSSWCSLLNDDILGQSKIEGYLPYYFYEGAAVILDDVLHILGSAYSEAYGKYHYYKTSTGSWVSAKSIPYRFNRGCAVVLNGEIHILGGYYSTTSHYKLSNNEWVEVSTLPYNFCSGCAIILNDEIHIFGGSHYEKYHYKYSNGEWISVSTLPYGCNSGSAVVLNNEIHIIGGYDSTSSGSTAKDHYKWNGTTWSRVSTLPNRFYRGSAVVYNGEIYIIGGSLTPWLFYKYSNGAWIQPRKRLDLETSHTYKFKIQKGAIFPGRSVMGAFPLTGEDASPVNYLMCLTPDMPVEIYEGAHWVFGVKLMVFFTVALTAKSTWPAAQQYIMFQLGGTFDYGTQWGSATVNSLIEDVGYPETTIDTDSSSNVVLGPSSSIAGDIQNAQNSIALGDKTIITRNNQIVLGKNNEEYITDYSPVKPYILAESIYDHKETMFVIGNGEDEVKREDIFTIDKRGNAYSKGGNIWAQGQINGQLIRKTPFWYELEDGTAYLLTLNSVVNTNDAYRWHQVYMLIARFDPRGTGIQTTALAVPSWVSLGASGTVGTQIYRSVLGYVYTDPATGTTYQRYRGIIGIGSTATNITTRFSLVKVMGSMEDFS